MKIKQIIILLAHGSKEKYVEKTILVLKRKLSKYINKKTVNIYHAFLQFNKPTLQECLNKTLASQIQDLRKVHRVWHPFAPFPPKRHTSLRMPYHCSLFCVSPKILIIPIFISQGKHTLVDLPRIISDFRKNHKGVTIKLALPLGGDDLLVKLLYKRYKNALRKG